MLQAINRILNFCNGLKSVPRRQNLGVVAEDALYNMNCGFLGLEGAIAVSSREMQQIEEAAVEKGLSKLSMMENAGANVAIFVHEISHMNSTHQKRKIRAVLVAGTGNNGGDAFVAARHLAFWKNDMELSLFLIGEEANIKAQEANINWNILKRFEEIDATVIDTEEKLSLLEQKGAQADVIVSGIFGTGFKGKPKALQRKAIEKINEGRKADVISVDLPSGMDADNGSYEIAVKSTYTIAMHAPKTGILTESGRQVSGQVFIANIGNPS